MFQGPTKDIPTYLKEHLHVEMGRFQNPADFIIKLAQVPHKVQKGLTLDHIVHSYRKH